MYKQNNEFSGTVAELSQTNGLCKEKKHLAFYQKLQTKKKKKKQVVYKRRTGWHNPLSLTENSCPEAFITLKAKQYDETEAWAAVWVSFRGVLQGSALEEPLDVFTNHLNGRWVAK